MPKPTLSLTLEEIRHEAADDIRWLEEVAAKHQSWVLPQELLVLAREFEVLACAEPLDAEQVANFTARLAVHIKQNRLKGIDPMLWRAEALQTLAREKKGAV